MATVKDDAVQHPPPVMAEARQWAGQDATPVEQFIAEAVMDKIAAVKTEVYFGDRRRRANLTAFDSVLARTGREAPRPDDAVPPGWSDAPSC
jgi:hypothetical protein